MQTKFKTNNLKKSRSIWIKDQAAMVKIKLLTLKIVTIETSVQTCNKSHLKS